MQEDLREMVWQCILAESNSNSRNRWRVLHHSQGSIEKCAAFPQNLSSKADCPQTGKIPPPLGARRYSWEELPDGIQTDGTTSRESGGGDPR